MFYLLNDQGDERGPHFLLFAPFDLIHREISLVIAKGILSDFCGSLAEFIVLGGEYSHVVEDDFKLLKLKERFLCM